MRASEDVGTTRSSHVPGRQPASTARRRGRRSDRQHRVRLHAARRRGHGQRRPRPGRRRRRRAWNRTWLVTTTTVSGLGAVVTDLGGYGEAIVQPTTADEAPSRFLSPIGVAQLSTDLAAEGPGPLIRLMAIASIGLGVMNALPLPPLDGGHAAVVGVESVVSRVRRRPDLRLDTSNRVVAAVTAVTFVLVITLGASAILFDLASPVSL